MTAELAADLSGYDLEPRSGEGPMVQQRLRAFATLIEDGVPPNRAAIEVGTHPAYGLSRYRKGGKLVDDGWKLAAQLMARIAPQALAHARGVAHTILGANVAQTAMAVLDLVENPAKDKDGAAAKRVQLEACRLIFDALGVTGNSGTTVNVDNRQLHVHGHDEALEKAKSLLASSTD